MLGLRVGIGYAPTRLQAYALVHVGLDSDPDHKPKGPVLAMRTRRRKEVFDPSPGRSYGHTKDPNPGPNPNPDPN